MKSNWHVATAAEAIAAAQFSRLGYDVSVQYGANQPEYDLIVAGGQHMLKISVKGSRDGAWGLTQSILAAQRKADPAGPTDYRKAADTWLKRHNPRTAVCFVQFKDVPIDALPRIYIAWPRDIAALLKAAPPKGSTVLRERSSRNRDASLLFEWLLTADRLRSLILSKEL